ncbi:hypothetical protein RhiirC2_744638 [Rhizophagus irregularis]|uniref:Uncharacterized protein n=1 Tax=Rhizophagus irregularis TaxID=588596 RepID=A0A2N1NC01_9GLOM|nr:hypothetical protein RhiirC2_744638 [Rhizophagus irregularis]
MSFIKKLSKFINKLNISDKDSNPVKINHENCYDPDNKKYWCKECVPRCIIEGWTSCQDSQLVDLEVPNTSKLEGKYN